MFLSGNRRLKIGFFLRNSQKINTKTDGQGADVCFPSHRVVPVRSAQDCTNRRQRRFFCANFAHCESGWHGINLHTAEQIGFLLPMQGFYFGGVSSNLLKNLPMYWLRTGRRGILCREAKSCIVPKKEDFLKIKKAKSHRFSMKFRFYSKNTKVNIHLR